MPMIKVLRDYSGAEGTDADRNVLAGTTHLVTRARAAQLKASGLIEVVGDDVHPDDEEEDDMQDEKAAAAPKTKEAPKPRNKAEKPAANKDK